MKSSGHKTEKQKKAKKKKKKKSLGIQEAKMNEKSWKRIIKKEWKFWKYT